jgi:hypothetical protein
MSDHPDLEKNVEFPKAVGSYTAARAYRTLKLSFSKQQAIREEQYFSRMEMAEEAKAAGLIRKPLYCAYSLFSDYGFNVWKPALLLLVTTAIASVVYALLAGLNPCTAECPMTNDLFLISLSQALPLPGFDKFAESANTRLFGASYSSIALTLTIILHKAISLLALFLMGLGLRNLFKLK